MGFMTEMACGAHDKGGMHTVHGCTWGLEQGSYVRFKTEVTCGIQDRCNIHMRFRTGVHTHGVQSRDGIYKGFRTGWDV